MAQMTAGTTWHTAGLVWRLRPNDVEIELLATTRNLLRSLEEETGLDPGWIQNGGLFISHSAQRTNEYRRLQTLGKCFDVESHILSPEETQAVFPLLDSKSFENSLYSPGDGVVDPAMMCAALSKSSISNGGRVIENCPVDELIVGENHLGVKDIRGVKTPFGKFLYDTKLQNQKFNNCSTYRYEEKSLIHQKIILINEQVLLRRILSSMQQVSGAKIYWLHTAFIYR